MAIVEAVDKEFSELPPKPPMKTYTLDEDQARQLEGLAAKNAFFASMLENYRRYGTLTEKQYRAFKREFDDALPRVAGVIVVNRLLRDDKVVCFRCREFATRAIGNVGVCEAHVAEQEKANAEYHASRPKSEP